MRKKNIAGIVVLAAVTLILLGGVLTGFARKSGAEGQASQYQESGASQRRINDGEQSQDITAGKGESLVYGELTFVAGNEIVCAAADGGEGTEYEIPVGTEVVTRLGAVTTFSRLSKGNEVALLLDADSGVIKKVWMLS